MKGLEGFLGYFEEIEDPRISRAKKHELVDIIVIAVLSFICGAQTWNEIEDFGKANKKWLKKHLSLSNGVPSHDTFARVFARVNPRTFQNCFVTLMKSWMEQSEGELIALDGKTLRRSHNRRHGQGCLHLVSAWASRNRLVLGQVKTASKSNEITAIKELLCLIDVKKCTVSIDAIGCQKAIAEQIKEAGGDYLLAVKGNQGHLHQGLITLFSRAKQLDYQAMVFSKEETIDGEHGRIETRRYTVLPSMYHFGYQKQWKGLQSFIQVESKREKNEKITVEHRYYISSLKPKAKELGHAIRQHWSVENSLHWSLDVTFNEDQSRIRKGHAPENVAILRRFVLSLLKAETSFNAGIRRKQRKALMDKDYLKLIVNSI